MLTQGSNPNSGTYFLYALQEPFKLSETEQPLLSNEVSAVETGYYLPASGLFILQKSEASWTFLVRRMPLRDTRLPLAPASPLASNICKY